MKKVVIKKTGKGGKRIPNKLELGTQRLLKVLWDSQGGVRACEKEADIAAQKFIHWRNKGKVSLKMVGTVSRALGLPREALNYEEMGSLAGENTPWDKLVKKLLDKKDAEWVLEGEPPTPFYD